MTSRNDAFWQALDTLLHSGKLVIDRPKGSTHPKYPSIRYEVDYGYIESTSSMDGGGVDVWRGPLPTDRVDAVICTVDLLKRDSEIKLLVGCSEEEIQAVYGFHNRTEFMKGLLMRRDVNASE